MKYPPPKLAALKSQWAGSAAKSDSLHGHAQGISAHCEELRSRAGGVKVARKGKPRLPWKRGRVAFELACRAEELIRVIESNPRGFYSLRKAAELFGMSTQPLRDWVRLKYVKRDGPRGQFSRSELIRFLHWLERRAEPYDSDRLIDRFAAITGRLPAPFERLGHARFLWPKGKPKLSPRELAELIGCHPSLIVKAIHYHDSLGRRRSRGRWEISRQRWRNTFFFSRISEPRAPSLPRRPVFTTRETALLLTDWGMPRVTDYRVRRMIKRNELAGIPPPPGKRKWLVTRKSLEKLRNELLTR